MNKEKSGIDLLKEINEKLDLLNKRLEIVEQNSKIMLNTRGAVEQPKEFKPSIAPTPKPIEKKPRIINDHRELKRDDKGTEFKGVKGKTKVIGKIKKDNKFVAGVMIKVFDSQKNLVKQTKTNRAGEWMSFLPEGTYSAIYSLKDMINAKVNFNVTAGNSIVRVPQPKEI